SSQSPFRRSFNRTPAEFKEKGRPGPRLDSSLPEPRVEAALLLAGSRSIRSIRSISPATERAIPFSQISPIATPVHNPNRINYFQTPDLFPPFGNKLFQSLSPAADQSDQSAQFSQKPAFQALRFRSPSNSSNSPNSKPLRWKPKNPHAF